MLLQYNNPNFIKNAQHCRTKFFTILITSKKFPPKLQQPIRNNKFKQLLVQQPNTFGSGKRSTPIFAQKAFQCYRGRWKKRRAPPPKATLAKNNRMIYLQTTPRMSNEVYRVDRPLDRLVSIGDIAPLTPDSPVHFDPAFPGKRVYVTVIVSAF